MSFKDTPKPYGEPILTGLPDSVLSALYRTILSDLDIEEPRFDNMVHKQIMREVSNSSMRQVSSDKNNLKNALLKSVMTWYIFVGGLQVINVSQCEVGIQIWHNDESKPTVLTFQEMVLRPVKGKELTKTDTILSKLFQGLMFEMKIDTDMFTELLALYISRSQIPIDQDKISGVRGVVKKEFMSDRMSWKVFIKALIFLDVKQFVFAIKLKHFNGKETIHQRSIIMDQMQEFSK